MGICSLGTMVATGLSLVFVGLFLVFSSVSSNSTATLAVKKPSDDPRLPVPPASRPQVPGQVEKCQVQDYERVPCGEPGINATQCNAINCCFDGQQCYYGKMGKLDLLFDLNMVTTKTDSFFHSSFQSLSSVLLMGSLCWWQLEMQHFPG